MRLARRLPRVRGWAPERTPGVAVPGAAVASAGTLERGLAAGRPPVVWALSLLFAFKSLVAFAVVAFPLSAQEPARVLAAGGVVALAAAGGVWLFGSRIPMLGFELLAAAGVIAISCLVAAARTSGGMMVAAFAYPWVAIYAAHFFPRRVVHALGLLVAAGLAVGLAVDGLPNPAIYWFVVTATVWSVCIVLGGLSEGVRRQVGTDQLTGVLNRTGFAAAAVRERAIADRTGAPLTVATIDLDGFKQVNDRSGHATGDRLLASLAGGWRARLRPGDILARHGGDEFVLLLPSTSEREAETALGRLDDEAAPVGWSSGVSEWARGEQLSAALARADARLYEAKLARSGIPAGRGDRAAARLAAARAIGGR